jgi:hypothetical protein
VLCCLLDTGHATAPRDALHRGSSTAPGTGNTQVHSLAVLQYTQLHSAAVHECTAQQYILPPARRTRECTAREQQRPACVKFPLQGVPHPRYVRVGRACDSARGSSARPASIRALSSKVAVVLQPGAQQHARCLHKCRLRCHSRCWHGSLLAGSDACRVPGWGICQAPATCHVTMCHAPGTDTCSAPGCGMCCTCCATADMTSAVHLDLDWPHGAAYVDMHVVILCLLCSASCLCHRPRPCCVYSGLLRCAGEDVLSTKSTSALAAWQDLLQHRPRSTLGACQAERGRIKVHRLQIRHLHLHVKVSTTCVCDHQEAPT